MKSIVFVCSGNTCRSPLAEVIARRVFASRTARDRVVSSAGSSATEGMSASEHAVEIAQQDGLDLSDHRSRPLSKPIIEGADLIVTMGARHRSAVGVIDSDALDHTFMLTEFCDELDGDVPDPIGGDLETYRHTYDTILRCIESMAAKLDDFQLWKSTTDD
ncbi:MAG: low molecular weight protein arginine phosphatase [Candidatus Krumholzibacteriota bacterium]|nr:low molecular weight protein arginine phosphatase [Candidatus Krumholzibacteriota bacterium]